MAHQINDFAATEDSVRLDSPEDSNAFSSRNLSGQEKKRLLRQGLRLYQEASVGLCCLDTDLRYIHINDWLASLHGLPAEDHVGRYVADVLPPAVMGLECQLRKVMQTGKPDPEWCCDAEPINGHGQVRRLLYSCHPMNCDDGTILGVICLVQDVTEQNRALDAARRIEVSTEAEDSSLDVGLIELSNREVVVGKSPAWTSMFHEVNRVAPTDASVLLLGETGSGKCVAARAIHARSKRRNRFFSSINCAAIPEGLIESELFGHEKGAFTGAVSRQIGRFERANGGTVFLDEIAELPVDLQAKLLGVLQDGKVQRLGSSTVIAVNTRIIAATNQDLNHLMEIGKFRTDLFYRLGVFPISVPPLRRRKGDIPLLVWHFVARLGVKLGRSFDNISNQTMARLEGYDWPGNVRELSNVIERGIILSQGTTLELTDFEQSCPNRHGQTPGSAAPGDATLQDAERDHIQRVLEQCGWRIGGVRGAAKYLGLKRTTLQSRIKRLGIQRPSAYGIEAQALKRP